MEKEVKIGSSLEGDIAIPEFEKKETETEGSKELGVEVPEIEPEHEDGIKTWEDEGGSVDVEEKTSGQGWGSLEADKDLPVGKWWKIMKKFKDELPADAQDFLEKAGQTGGYLNLSKANKKNFHAFRNKWWLTKFGINFNDWLAYSRRQYREAKKDLKKEKQPEDISGKIAFRMMNEARGEFTEGVLQLLDKKLKEGMLNSKEQMEFNKARSEWFQNRFGIVFERRKELAEIRKQREVAERLEKKMKTRSFRKSELLRSVKVRKMRELHEALRNLDNGEVVEQFRDETRRIVYFDKEANRYFTEKEDGNKQYLGMGDIAADNEWGIKYVPDGEMIEPAYRTAAKRILINETRRDIEHIYDQELAGYGVTKPVSSEFLEKKWLNKESRHPADIGIIAERMARELLTRFSINEGLNFTVMRANAVEDSIYKYDFKLRAFKKDRGVAVENQPLKAGIKRIGIQFTIRRKFGGKPKQIKEAKSILPDHKLVDDIILIKVETNEFADSFDKWLETGKPSGGPEQFLSRDLKIRLLKEITKGLVEISDEDIERIFLSEESRKPLYPTSH